MVSDFAQLMQFSNLDQQSPVVSPPIDDDQWVEIFRGLHRDPNANVRGAWFAAGFLLATTSRRIRNAAALALADMRAQDAAGSIVAVLRRPNVAKESGTLLYALGELGASLPLSVFVGLMENGSYEARAAALMFLEKNRIGGRDDVIENDAWARLSRLAGDTSDPEGAEAADLALEYLRAG